MDDVKYIAITERFKSDLITLLHDEGLLSWEQQLRDAPQAEVKRRDIPHSGLVFEIITRCNLDVGDGAAIDELPDHVLRALVTKVGGETTEVCK